MPLATISDVTARWVYDSPIPDDDFIKAQIADAEVLVYTEFPDLDDRITADDATDSPGKLGLRAKMVVERMVLRYLSNPDGYTSETIGQSTTSRKVGKVGLYLDDDDLAMLTATGQEAAGMSAFTINPTPAASVTRVWAGQDAADLAGVVVNSDDAPSDPWW